MTDAAAQEESAAEAAAFLAEQLGRRLLALTVGVDMSTVSRWVSGRSRPSTEAAERLRAAVAVWRIIAEVDDPEVVRVWFMTMKDALDDYSPAEMIAAGNLEDVAAVARAYVQRA